MSNILQTLTKEGYLANIGPGVRVTINPVLRGPQGQILGPDDVTVSDGFIVANKDNGDGTFDAQSISSVPQTLEWTATNYYTTQYNPSSQIQTTVGPLPGRNPSLQPAIPIEGVKTFLELTDAPQPPTYVGNALKLVGVNAGATGLAFYTVTPSGDILPPLSAGIPFALGDSFKDVDITLGRASCILALGRVYIAVDPGAPFFNTLTLGFYNNPSRKDNQLIWQGQMPLILTNLSIQALVNDTFITVVSSAQFVNGDLLYLMGATPEFRRISTIALNVLNLVSPVENIHLLGAGVSNAPEFGGTVLWDTTAANKIYARLSFPAALATALTINLDLTVRS